MHTSLSSIECWFDIQIAPVSFREIFSMLIIITQLPPSLKKKKKKGERPRRGSDIRSRVQPSRSRAPRLVVAVMAERSSRCISPSSKRGKADGRKPRIRTLSARMKLALVRRGTLESFSPLRSGSGDSFPPLFKAFLFVWRQSKLRCSGADSRSVTGSRFPPLGCRATQAPLGARGTLPRARPRALFKNIVRLFCEVRIKQFKGFIF